MNDRLFSIDGYMLGLKRAGKLRKHAQTSVDEALLISKILKAFGEGQGEDLTIMDLANALEEDFDAIRSAVDVLVDEGYVERVAKAPSGNDALRVVSPKGLQALIRASQI